MTYMTSFLLACGWTKQTPCMGVTMHADSSRHVENSAKILAGSLSGGTLKKLLAYLEDLSEKERPDVLINHRPDGAYFINIHTGEEVVVPWPLLDGVSEHFNANVVFHTHLKRLQGRMKSKFAKQPELDHFGNLLDPIKSYLHLKRLQSLMTSKFHGQLEQTTHL